MEKKGERSKKNSFLSLNYPSLKEHMLKKGGGKERKERKRKERGEDGEKPSCFTLHLPYQLFIFLTTGIKIEKQNKMKRKERGRGKKEKEGRKG